jgi:hypothetical protein
VNQGAVTALGIIIMRAGDLVRFREVLEHGYGLHRPTVYTEWKIGLLKQYHTWEKIATIIYEGKEIRVRAENTQLHKRAKRK